MCVGSSAGVTYLRYTVLMSSNKSETAVHCCDPALSVLVMLVSRNVFHVVSALQSFAECRLRTAECRLRTEDKMKTEGKMQTAHHTAGFLTKSCYRFHHCDVINLTVTRYSSLACRTGRIFAYFRRIEAKGRRARSASRARGEER